MKGPDAGEPRWPRRVKEICIELPRAGSDGQSAESLRGELWLLLNSAICSYLRVHSRRIGRIAREDEEDIAATKSLDLLRSAEEGSWEVSGRHPAEIAGFLSTIARNGLIDLLRKRGREVTFDPLDSPDAEDESAPSDWVASPVEPPDTGLERREFVERLHQCAKLLDRRSLRVWFFRIFYEMTSKEIAAHPDVAVKPSHVDVLLQRAREKIQECMRKQGLDPGELPPGTFVTLWRSFFLPADSGAGGSA